MLLMYQNTEVVASEAASAAVLEAALEASQVMDPALALVAESEEESGEA
jgi:hypothetical protein